MKNDAGNTFVQLEVNVTGTELAVIVALALAALAAVVAVAIVWAMIQQKLEAAKESIQQKLEVEKKYKAHWSKNRVRSKESREIGYLNQSQGEMRIRRIPGDGD